MKIKVERSGGLAGITVIHEMDVEDLPSGMKDTAKNIASRKILSFSKKIPTGAPDHFVYKVSIGHGQNQRVIECNQYDIQRDLKMLISYIEKNSKKDQGSH